MNMASIITACATRANVFVKTVGVVDLYWLSSLSLQLLLLTLWGFPSSSARARDIIEYCSSDRSYVTGSEKTTLIALLRKSFST